MTVVFPLVVLVLLYTLDRILAGLTHDQAADHERRAK